MKQFGFLVCGTLLVAIGIEAVAFAQSQPSSQAAKVSRTAKAMHYRPGASVRVPFQATESMSGASGEAKVEARKAT